MTHSVPAGSGDKRGRLVRSATQLMHQRGVDSPTLAEIARAASVPAGNVYYYFKTRDELVDAVVAAHLDGIRQLLAGLDQMPSSADRLRALADVWLDNRKDITRYGCPIGTLCAELTKHGASDGNRAALFAETIAWAEGRFGSLGSQTHEPSRPRC